MDHKQVITRQQYLVALELVDMYHRQSSKEHFESFDRPQKTSMFEWVNSLDKKPSTRLHRILMKFDYLEDVHKPAFFDIRNSGQETWAEFCLLANIKS